MSVRAPTIFDLGAHKGSTAVKYKSIFPLSKVYCFEPFPESIEHLKARFKHDDSVRIVPFAADSQTGRRTFYVNEFDAANSLLPRPVKERRYYPTFAGAKSQISVDAISIDDFVRQEHIDVLHILKLDIQGGELKALNGAVDTLKKLAVPMIYTETMFIPHYEDNPLLHDLWSFLSPFGYSLFDIYNLKRAANGQLRFGDALFVHDDLRTGVINRFPEEP